MVAAIPDAGDVLALVPVPVLELVLAVVVLVLPFVQIVALVVVKITAEMHVLVALAAVDALGVGIAVAILAPGVVGALVSVVACVEAAPEHVQECVETDVPVARVRVVVKLVVVDVLVLVLGVVHVVMGVGVLVLAAMEPVPGLVLVGVLAVPDAPRVELHVLLLVVVRAIIPVRDARVVLAPATDVVHAAEVAPDANPPVPVGVVVLVHPVVLPATAVVVVVPLAVVGVFDKNKDGAGEFPSTIFSCT